MRGVLQLFDKLLRVLVNVQIYLAIEVLSWLLFKVPVENLFKVNSFAF